MSTFSIDGTAYNVNVVSGSLRRTAEIRDGKNAGPSLSGLYVRDITGTFYHYAMTVNMSRLSPSQYDAFYQAITAPTSHHTVVVPYGQSSLTFKAYIKTVKDELLAILNGVNIWTNLSIEFVAAEPNRMRGQ